MRNFFVLVLNTTVYIQLLLLLFFTFFLQPLFQIWQRSVVSVCQTQTYDSVMTWWPVLNWAAWQISTYRLILTPERLFNAEPSHHKQELRRSHISHMQWTTKLVWRKKKRKEKKKRLKCWFFLDVNFQPQHQISPTFTTCHAQVLLHGILRPTTASGSTAGELRDTYHHSFVRSWQPERNLPVVLKRDKEHWPCYPRNCRKTASDTGIIVIVCATSASSSNCTKKF